MSDTPPTTPPEISESESSPDAGGGAEGYDAAVRESLRKYWRTNVYIMSALLAIWAIVGLGCGVLFADALNKAGSIGGYPMGFWFAQQGSMIVFVLLILIYCILLNRLDAKHHEELEQLKKKGGE